MVSLVTSLSVCERPRRWEDVGGGGLCRFSSHLHNLEISECDQPAPTTKATMQRLQIPRTRPQALPTAE